MKKTLLAVTIFALTTNMSYAANSKNQADTQIDNNYKTLLTQNDTDKRSRMSYFGIQIGTGEQSASELYTTSENRLSSSKSNLDFNSSVFSLVWGTDYYQSQNKTPFRLETALTIRNSKKLSYTSRIDTNLTVHKAGMKVGLDSLMVNGYFDFHNISIITPYIMAGFGGAIPFSIEDNITSASSSSYFYPIKTSALAGVWSLGFGATIAANPNFTIDVGAKYSEVGETSTTFKDSKLAYNPTYSISGISAIELTIGFRLNY